MVLFPYSRRHRSMPSQRRYQPTLPGCAHTNGVNREAATTSERAANSPHPSQPRRQPGKDKARRRREKRRPIDLDCITGQATETTKWPARVSKHSKHIGARQHSKQHPATSSPSYAYMYSVRLSSRGSLLYKVDGVTPPSLLLLRVPRCLES